MEKLPKIIVVFGATSSGKSNLSDKIYNSSNKDFMIINGDSAQLYQELPILTAIPSDYKKYNSNKIISLSSLYRIWSIFDNKDDKSVKSWLNLCIDNIDTSRINKITPVIVGGTGMYISSLIEGINNMPSHSTCLYRKYENDINEKKISVQELYNKLIYLDKDLAIKLSHNDKQRIIRGLSFYESTGTKLSTWQNHNQISNKYKENEFLLIYIDPPKEILQERIIFRLDKMIAEGVIDEVENIMNLTQKYKNDNKEYSLPRIIGLNEIIDYIKGKIDINNMKEKIICKTRQYAKRQNTWFRNKILKKFPSITTIYSDNKIDKIYINDILSQLRQ
ncbi:tRNA (adenosine(37)-N6)-dimethylallyltransferase MiaA [Lyticum sinuosum]|uniref:tRNA dimethylallyltransferase n=1 Tax=Lyticum sinuosum TaxID=1332059 RepID=A0AAE5AH49_9RICK|nr:tRNA (adenosine(37)-N6)-dimethylallyltransferase MiaA [Lyticum sinuosum]MDZ5761175.1 tRNA dimethylallyltransferase [Lyticum sinuosum]